MAGFDINEMEDEHNESDVDKGMASQADLCWYDSLVDKQNISKADQEGKTTTYHEGGFTVPGQSPFGSRKRTDRIRLNKTLLAREASLEKLK